MKTIFLLLLVLCCCFTLFSQNQSIDKTDFIITNTQDTIRGTIRDRLKLREEVSFRRNGETDFDAYTPNDILAFYVQSGLFYKTQEIAPGKKIFLLVLAEGTLHLYKDPLDAIFYLQKNQGNLVKLEKKEKLTQDGYVEDIAYQTILSAIISDCPTLINTVKKVNFDENSLSKFVEKYNNCINPAEKAQVYNTNAKLKIEKGIKVGVISNRMKFLETVSIYDREKFTTYQGFTGGIFVKIIFRKEIFALQPELLFTQKGGSFVVRNSFDEDIIEYSFGYLQLPISIYYTPAIPSSIKPFFYAGVIGGYAPFKDINKVKNISNYPTSTTNEELGWRGGAGVQWRVNANFGLQLEYLYENTTINKNSVTNKIQHGAHGIKLGLSF